MGNVEDRLVAGRVRGQLHQHFIQEDGLKESGTKYVRKCEMGPQHSIYLFLQSSSQSPDEPMEAERGLVPRVFYPGRKARLFGKGIYPGQVSVPELGTGALSTCAADVTGSAHCHLA